MMHSFSDGCSPDRELIEDLGAIVWEADPVTLQVLYVNHAAERLLGYPRAEWLSRHDFWSEIIHPDDRDAVVTRLRLAVERGIEHQCDYRVTAADGSIRAFRAIVRVGRDQTGGVGCLRGLMVDVTDAKRRLDHIFQRVAAVEALARITSAVAHDLRNVFMVVSGNADLALEKDMGDGLSRELTEIRVAADVGTSIIKQLSTAGRHHSRTAIVDVNDAVLEVRTFLERLLKPVATLVIGATAPKARVLTDSGALHQVLLNLIVNAKEAMVSTAGVVTITTRNVRAGARGNPLDSIDFVELEVSDTGVGIPADIRERIFDLHFTTKGERRGSGIGLASVAAIVRDAGGTVSVESQPDSGSTFRIRLPLAPDHG